MTGHSQAGGASGDIVVMLAGIATRLRAIEAVAEQFAGDLGSRVGELAVVARALSEQAAPRADVTDHVMHRIHVIERTVTAMARQMAEMPRIGEPDVARASRTEVSECDHCGLMRSPGD